MRYFFAAFLAVVMGSELAWWWSRNDCTIGPPMLSKVGLFLVYAIPVAFLVALAVGGKDDTSIGPNFALLGTLGTLVALIVAIVIAWRRRCFSWPWIGALVANLAMVAIAYGSIDFQGFGGGGH